MVTLARRSAPVRGSRRSRREEGGVTREQKRGHVPVMLREVLEILTPLRGEVVVDATYGAGGHSAALRRSGARVITLDADPEAGAEITANFAELDSVLKELGVWEVHKVLFDLGWRFQQRAAGRGFSFQANEPLLMSYGPRPYSGFFARDILNTWSEKAIADVLFGYGEERHARHIAKAIVARRQFIPIMTTVELVEIIRDAVPASYRHGRIHPATRTFQALRIAVNDELRALEQGLALAWKHLARNGRIAVIAFHSVEDRVVKQQFSAFVKQGGRLLTKKPRTPSAQEIAGNTASRSAKLRAIEKLCDK